MAAPPATAGLRLPVCLLPETDTCAGWGCSGPPSTEGVPVRAVRVKLVDFWVPLKSVKVVEHRCYRKVCSPSDGWPQWTRRVSRGRLLAAHDSNHPSRAWHCRSDGRDGTARRLGHRCPDRHRHRRHRHRYLRAARGHADGSSWLPEINASLNGTAAVLLSTGYVFIRRRRVAAHRACMIAAFAASSLFLIIYLIHHARVGSVAFHGAAWLRPVYFGLLVPHIVLAAVVVPLALTTIYLAWSGRFDRHRRLARVTLPIWLYVSVSGVLVYVLLYHGTEGR